MSPKRFAFFGLLLAGAACSAGPVRPAPLDTKNETCRSCRMAVSDARFAAQLAAPNEEPRFFDDIGCLRDFLKETKSLPKGAIAFVADHRTREWVVAGAALYTKVPGLETPMTSHVIAHVDAASRDADPDARGGASVTVPDVFGAALPTGGRR